LNETKQAANGRPAHHRSVIGTAANDHAEFRGMDDHALAERLRTASKLLEAIADDRSLLVAI